jgi:hypothetical protein
LASILIGDLVLETKLGLSILIINSIASKKGFLKSIVGGLAPAILKGPLG